MKFCKKCQSETERYPSGGCKACCKINEAKWRALNPELNKAKNTAWQAANRDKFSGYAKAYRIGNVDKLKEYNAAYCAANKEKRKASTALWCAVNYERVKATSDAWRAANPEAMRVIDQNRRERKRLNGGILSKGLVDRLLKLQNGKCLCCGLLLGIDYHLDHIMPIYLGGSNTDDNMQLLRKRCNLQKNSKHPVDFMQSRGFLL